jgi:predicted membrane protein
VIPLKSLKSKRVKRPSKKAIIFSFVFIVLFLILTIVFMVQFAMENNRSNYDETNEVTQLGIFFMVSMLVSFCILLILILILLLSIIVYFKRKSKLQKAVIKFQGYPTRPSKPIIKRQTGSNNPTSGRTIEEEREMVWEDNKEKDHGQDNDIIDLGGVGRFIMVRGFCHNCGRYNKHDDLRKSCRKCNGPISFYQIQTDQVVGMTKLWWFIYGILIIAGLISLVTFPPLAVVFGIIFIFFMIIGGLLDRSRENKLRHEIQVALHGKRKRAR